MMNPNSSETILSRISDAFVVLDQDCRFTYVNDRYCEIVDTEREALLGQIVWELFPETADSEVHRQFQRALSEQIPVEFEWLLSAWNRWFEYRVYPSPDGLTIFLTEISDRKQAEAALHQREAQFRQLADAMPQIVWIADAEGNPEYVSQRWVDYTGLTLEQTAEQNWLNQAIHPEDLEPTYKIWRACLETGTLYQTEFRLKQAVAEQPETAYRWFLCRAVPIHNSYGQITHWYGTLTDLHERKQTEMSLRQSEARFRRIFECNMVPMGVWSRSGGILHANDALLDLLGYARQELEAGQISWRTITSPEWSPEDEAALAEIAAKGFSTPYEKEFFHKQGHRVPILMGGASFLDEQDTGIFFAVDLTERQQVEVALRRSEGRQAFLLKFNDTLRPLMDAEEIQHRAACVLGEHLGANRVGYAENHGDGETIVVTRNYTNGVPGVEGRYRYDDYGEELLEEFQAGRIVTRSDIANDITLTDVEKAAHAVLQVGATMNVPLVKAGRLIAVLFVHYQMAHHWLAEEVALIQDVADRTWAAVEQARAEVALRQSEERYRTLFESIDEGFCIIEMLFDENNTPVDYCFLEVNPVFEQQTGLQQAVGKTARQLVPDLEDFWIETYGRVALTGEPMRFEHRSAPMHRWFDVYACRTGDPERRKVAVVFKDISGRKQAEEILRRDTNLSAFRVSLTDALRLLADPIEVQAIASRLLGEYLGVNRVAYFEVSGTDYVVEQDYVNGVTALVGKYPIDSFGAELLAAYRTGRPVCVSDVTTDVNLTTDQQSAYAAIQIGAYIGIPLIKQGEFVARMAVHTAKPRAWTPDEVTLVQEVAERIWSAIERAQIEAELRRSEAEFRIISNAAPALVWVGAQDGSVIFFNERWYEFTGQTEAEAISFGWASATHPDDVARILPYWKHCRQTGETYEGEARYRRHDGEYCWYAFRALPRRNEAGEIEAWYGLSIDISERKRSEAERKQAAAEREQLLQQEQTLRQQAEIAERKLHALLASIREDFLLFDHDWRVAYLNPQAELTMQRPRDQILGHCIWELFPDLVGTEYYHRLHQVMREQAPVQFEYHYDTWDVWFDNRVYPSPEGITILCTNITNRKRAEAEREQLLAREQVAREAAEAANRIKDEFLAVVSHELRSPLNPILGWAKLLRTRQLDAEKTERALEVIERNAQMQAQLINDLLDVSRILRGKLSLETKPIDLAATIQAAMETVRLAAEAKSIQIRTQFEPDVGQVVGDAGRLQQVIWNLLTNAVKFTSEGGLVEVRLERGDEGERGGKFTASLSSSSYAQITVTDTGKGIPPDFLPHVFEQFRQESSATTRRFGGLGLGLAIVRYLVELHGGTIQADSPGDGQGATFTVRLPLMPHQPGAKPDPAPSEASIDLQGTRILVVDDDDNTREFLAFLLELHGANVIATATAGEVIATLSQFMPEVLLSDIGMPDVDGYMLLRQIRALPAEQGGTVPAIALTAYAGEIDYRQAMAAGFQRHMCKPLEPQALIQAIASLLEQSAAT